MILKNKNFLNKHDFEEHIIFKKQDFEEKKLFLKSRFRKNFCTQKISF